MLYRRSWLGTSGDYSSKAIQLFSVTIPSLSKVEVSAYILELLILSSQHSKSYLTHNSKHAFVFQTAEGIHDHHSSTPSSSSPTISRSSDDPKLSTTSIDTPIELLVQSRTHRYLKQVQSRIEIYIIVLQEDARWDIMHTLSLSLFTLSYFVSQSLGK